MPIAYSHEKFPPAPVLYLRLSQPGEPPQTPSLSALIDTGSDFTLASQRWLLSIDAPESRFAQVRGLWGPQHGVTLYLVDLHLDNGVLPGVEVIGIDHEEDAVANDEIILGRNVLNLLILLLEGPDNLSHVLERRPRRF